MSSVLLSWLQSCPSWLYWSLMGLWLGLGIVLVVLWALLSLSTLLGLKGKWDYPTRRAREKYGFWPWLLTTVAVGLVNFVVPASGWLNGLFFYLILVPQSWEREQLLPGPRGESLLAGWMTLEIVAVLVAMWVVGMLIDWGFDKYFSSRLARWLRQGYERVVEVIRHPKVSHVLQVMGLMRRT